MYTSLRNILALVLVTTVLFTACSLSKSSSSKTATTSSAQGTPVTGASTPEGTPDGIMLAPPILVAHAKSGTQQGNYGTFYWMLDSGLAAQVNSRGIEIPKNPLDVKKGESIQFTWEQPNSKSDSTLQEVTLSVYPKDQSIATVTAAQGTLQGFKAQSSPVASTPLPATNLTWTADVKSGSYFVLVKATWSNPVVADKTRNSEYGFWIKVS